MTISNSPFVGRARELEILLRALADTEHDAGRYIALVGEPGMGKTRLLSEVADAGRQLGRQVLFGQMIEDPGAPPYFPWMVALRSCLPHYTDEDLAADLGFGANVVAQVIPELRDRLQLPDSTGKAESNASRYQLFDCITRFLLNAASRNPLMLLFDNLHLADRSSLALLEYFCQQLAGHPVVVIGAHRDSELNRNHPLRVVLNRLSRTAAFLRLELGGLSRTEVAELLHAQLGDPPPPAVVDAVYGQSEGNPLFVAETAVMLGRRIKEQRLPAAGFHFKIPESLREVIATRLDAMPTAVTRLLGTAAVLGREFDSAFLAEMAGATGTQVARSLQVAEQAGVVTTLDRVRYRFHHVLFREVLYADHNTLSRVLLHRKAGELLESRFREGFGDHVSQLAYHFFESAQAGRERKAVNYCRQAAEAATAKRAYGEAAAQYDCALQALELGADPNPDGRFDLLLAMGQAQHHAGQLNDANQTLMKAAVLAYRQQAWRRLARALSDFQMVCQHSGYRHVASVPLHRATLEHLPEDDPGLRARTLASLAMAYRTVAEPELASAAFQESVSLARQCPDPRVLLACLRKGNWTVGRNPGGIHQGLEISREVLDLATAQGDSETALDARADIVFQLCDLGEIEQAGQHLRELRKLAEKQRQPHFQNVLAGFETAVAILRGSWEEALDQAGEAIRQVPLQGVPGLEGRYAFQVFAVKKARGTLMEVAELAGRIIAASNGAQLWLPGQILLHCELGQQAQAREALAQLGDPARLPADDLQCIALVYLAEACSNLRDRPMCARLFEQLAPYRGLNATLAGTLMLGAVSGFMAMLASALDKNREARELFEEALKMNRAMGALPALARTQVDFARLLLGSERPEDHLRSRKLMVRAGAIATELGLAPVLQAIEDLADGKESLTRRELDVLRLIATGSSNRGIADSLHISHSTVATHVRSIFRKTGAVNRTQAADFARGAALLDAD
jgi:ATP/maltotriose-dependent transcriptional regulator MalT